MSEDLRYPIGKFRFEGELTDEQRQQLITDIAETPSRLRAAVEGLDAQQLETPYRPAGWTVRQVVHHVPDSHLNSYIRFKLALTEHEPTIKAYDEGQWAELVDARTCSIEVSLALLESLHKRWVTLLESLSHRDFARTFKHPEIAIVSLDRNLALYSWHGRHHVAHLTRLRDRMSWN